MGKDISEQQLLTWDQTEKALRRRLEEFGRNNGACFRPLDRDEVLKRIRSPFWRGIGDAPMVPGWAPSAFVDQDRDGSVILTPDDSMGRLYAGRIDHRTSEGHLQVTQMVDGQPAMACQSFLTVEQFSPTGIDLPGGEWAKLLQRVGPVELHIRWTPLPYRQTLEAIESQKRKHDDTTQQEAEFTGRQTIDTATSENEAEELEQYVKATRSPTLDTYVVIGVTGKDKETLQQRTKDVSALFEALDTKLALNGTDQVKHFYETIPAARRLVDDYTHRMVPMTLGASLFGATLDLLDPEGTFFGTDAMGRPTFLNVRRALAILDTAGNIACVGPMGKGKSATANFILWLAVLFGAKGLAIDSLKPGRSLWPQKLPLLGQYTTVVTLSSHGEDRGKLDPFVIFPDRSEAAKNAISYAAFLTQTDRHDLAYDVLLEAFNRVCDGSRNPCMEAGIAELDNLARDSRYPFRGEADRLAVRLRNMASLAWADLLFGDGSGAHIDTSARLTVLQLDRIRRPREGKDVRELDMDEFLGQAIMEASTGFANAWARGDRQEHKVLLGDEIRWFVASQYGYDLIAQQALGGRAMGTEVLLCGQNVSHLPADLHQHFTMRFAFGAGNEREAASTLEFLGAPDTAVNRARLMRLNPGDTKGQCLVRDLDGRIGELWVNMLFEDLPEAFDAKSLKEESA